MRIDEPGYDPPSREIDFPRFSRKLESSALPDRFDSAAAEHHDGVGKCRPAGAVDQRGADERNIIVRRAAFASDQ